MKNFIFAYCLFTALLFFCITAILGINYGGSEESSLYVYYCIATFLIVLFTFFKNYSFHRIRKSNLHIFFVAFMYLLAAILSGLWSDKSFLCYSAFCIPSICVGVYYGNKGGFGDIVKWLDVILWIVTLSMVFLTARFITSMNLGDRSYSQTLSYYSALAFLLDLFLVAYGKDYERFGIFERKLFKIISYVFLLIYPLMVLFSGGRGGFVTILVGFVVFILTLNMKRARHIIFIGAALLLLGLGLSSVFLDNASVEKVDDFQRNTNRVFAYLSSDGIDMSETSGRDYVYTKTWQLIGDNPIGYGLFSYKKIYRQVVDQPYPHNIFLEWLIQGGFLLFFLWFFFLVSILLKCHKLRKKGVLSPLFYPFLVYPLTQLMFSASYLEEPFFWFSITFIYVFNSTKDKRIVYNQPLASNS